MKRLPTPPDKLVGGGDIFVELALINNNKIIQILCKIYVIKYNIGVYNT